MVKNIVTFFLLLLCLAVQVRSEDAFNAELVERLKKVEKLPFKPEDALTFKTKTEYKGKHYDFHVVNNRLYFPIALKDINIAKYEKRGTIPFRITAELLEAKIGDKNARRFMRGQAWFLFIDAENKIVIDKKLSLAKLCPT